MAEEQPKHPGGRPTKYDPKFNEQAYKLCLLGADDSRLANFFDVSEQTINTWKQQHPEFLESLRAGKDEADATVSQKLYHRATGYEHEDVDIKQFQGEIITTKITKHYPPDTTAAIFWLKNRQKDKWRDQSAIDHTTKGKELPTPILGGISKHVSADNGDNQAQ